MSLPICCVTGRIAGDKDACGDCDPCGAAYSVPEPVKTLLKERDEWGERYSNAMGELDELRAAAASAEPVAWQWYFEAKQKWCELLDHSQDKREELIKKNYKLRPLYTHPAPAAASAKEPGYRTCPADGGQCLCDETEAVGCFNTPGSRAYE